MDPGPASKTQSGRIVKAPLRFSPERPVGGFEDDFDSEDYEDAPESPSESGEPVDGSDEDPDYEPGMRSNSEGETDEERESSDEADDDVRSDDTDAEDSADAQ
jgi:hypothetical protein